MSFGRRYSISKPAEDNDEMPVMGGAVPRQKVSGSCKSIDRYGDTDVDLVRNRSYSDEYFKRVARDLKSIPCLLLLGNIFAFVFLIIWSNIAKHLLTSAIETTMAPPMETTPSLIRSIRDHYTCNKPRCGAAGHALAYSINTTADPCRDIVEHVCSNWLLSSEENYQKVILGSARLYLEDMVVDLHLHHQNLRQSLIYDVNENALLLPAGLLQPPFFDPNVPHALNYGGLGVLMLNDMIREFFRFFFNDNKNTWRSAVKCITDRVYRKEDSQSGSLEESYKVFTVIFTMMTLRTAYNAYHYYLDMDDDFVIPGLKGTTNPDQLFFLSAVRTLCSQVRDEHRALLIINEGVTLMKKVKAALQGLDELQDAFNCRNEKRNSYVYCVETKGDAAEDD
ncbi:hypothetical protein ISCGN_017485 [Ixodes scapularis]